LNLHIYNFSADRARGHLLIESAPNDWELALDDREFALTAGERQARRGRLQIPTDTKERDGWVTIRADCGPLGRPVVAFRVRAASPRFGQGEQ